MRKELARTAGGVSVGLREIERGKRAEWLKRIDIGLEENQASRTGLKLKKKLKK